MFWYNIPIYYYYKTIYIIIRVLKNKLQVIHFNNKFFTRFFILKNLQNKHCCNANDLYYSVSNAQIKPIALKQFRFIRKMLKYNIKGCIE